MLRLHRRIRRRRLRVQPFRRRRLRLVTNLRRCRCAVRRRGLPVQRWGAPVVRSGPASCPRACVGLHVVGMVRPPSRELRNFVVVRLLRHPIPRGSDGGRAVLGTTVGDAVRSAAVDAEAHAAALHPCARRCRPVWSRKMRLVGLLLMELLMVRLSQNGGRAMHPDGAPGRGARADLRRIAVGCLASRGHGHGVAAPMAGARPCGSGDGLPRGHLLRVRVRRRSCVHVPRWGSAGEAARVLHGLFRTAYRPSPPRLQAPALAGTSGPRGELN
mmetsp:Transcript_78322/g.254410  ORF Transcript_78322/g.254410 Transcript_78322/m.254410 type:complete len:272 (+) Transcript_78322:2143-2958(+)